MINRKTLLAGLESLGLYLSLYPAVVAESEPDPDDRGRVKVIVPAVGSEPLPAWAMPRDHWGGKGWGYVQVPQPGDSVMVEFRYGRLTDPIYSGGWHARGEMPPVFKGYDGKVKRVWGWFSRAKNFMLVDDTLSKERIILRHAAGHYVSMTRDDGIIVSTAEGTIMEVKGRSLARLQIKNGTSVVLSDDGWTVVDAKGNTMSSQSGGVSIISQGDMTITAPSLAMKVGGVAIGDGASEPVVLGQSQLTQLMTHTHPTAMGPSGPPVGLTPSALSLSAKVK